MILLKNRKMGKVAFLFAGQGGQDGRTADVQPAIFRESLAQARALKIVPDCVAGFSLGEITALVFAGVLGEEIVEVRATAMQECCDKMNGAMVAVVRLGKVVDFPGAWAVNFNSPEQIVYSMDAGVVDEFSKKVASLGGRAIKLSVSGAFHSPHMKGASEKVAEFLKGVELGKPKMPIYSNVTAQPHIDKDLISKQIISPVLWQQTIENMIADGVDAFIECGPGNVLSGLVRKINDKVTVKKAEELL